MILQVKDLSAQQRIAIESLLGRALHDEESLTIRPSRIIKDAPTGEERARLFRQYQKHLDELADRVKDVPDKDIETAIDEAIRHVRQKTE